MKSGKYSDKNTTFKAKLREFLKSSGKKYGRFSLRQTIRDVLSLDDDLKEYVENFIFSGNSSADDLGCGEYVSMEELLTVYGYNPVTAALLIQLYRKEPNGALRILIGYDRIMIKENPKENYAEIKVSE